jgi:hypothetical protein
MKISANIKVSEKQSGEVKFSIISPGDVEKFRIYGDTTEDKIELTAEPGSQVSLIGASTFFVLSLRKNEQKTVVLKYKPTTSTEDQPFKVKSHSGMTIEKAVERYVENDTWLLELEDEIELALENG